MSGPVLGASGVGNASGWGVGRSASVGSMMEQTEKNYPAYYTHLTNGNTHSRPTDSALFLAFGLTGCFAAVEAAAGWWSGSLALLGDAGHMVTDSVALLIAALASWLGRRPLSPRHSYGFGRAQLIAALTNAVLILVLVTALVV